MAYLQRYDGLKEKKTAHSRNIKIPAKTKVISAEFDEVLLYGLRPLDPRIDSMSPWIFVLVVWKTIAQAKSSRLYFDNLERRLESGRS